ncbi:MAG: VOC family protein [Acidobacteria bacterium]|nr:VOC family protein [Acidobacteriota bacterium]
MNNLFHLAFPVKDLEEARTFYGEVLGCEEGRSSDAWIDFNLFGHQIVAHLAPESVGVQHRNEVDADHVPVPHFGIVLPMEDWKNLAEKLKAGGRFSLNNFAPQRHGDTEFFK